MDSGRRLPHVSAQVCAVLVAAIFWCSALPPAAMCEATPAVTNSFEADLAGALNPNGLLLLMGFGRRWAADGTDPLSSAVEAGAGLGVTPGYARGTVRCEWMPHPAIQLRAQYALYRYFGTSGALLSFDSPDDRYGDDVLEARQGEEETAWGQRFLVRPVLRAKLGRLLLRNVADFAWFRFSGRGPYFLEREYDTLLKDGDWLVADTLQALVRTWKGRGAAEAYLGPFFEVVRAGASGIVQQRAGVALATTVADRLWGVERPRFYLQGGLHLRDPNREGEGFILLGMGFDLGAR